MFVVEPAEGRKPIKIWRRDQDDLEAGALDQLRKVASLPFVFRHVAAMPDVHWGMGATVGSVVATVGAVVPSAVGVDIGCGMMAWRTDIPAAVLRPVAAALRAYIEAAVPVGFAAHKEPIYYGFQSATPMLGPDAKPRWLIRTGDGALESRVMDKARLQMGTLGGGNHFIEVAEDETGMAWVLLHTGSRGVGKMTADFYVGAAKAGCRMWGSPLPDPDLAFLPDGSPEYHDYMADLDWCQRYAWANREIIMTLVAAQVRGVADEAGFDWQFSSDGFRSSFRTDPSVQKDDLIHCHHNYATMEHHFGADVLVTRKGAISARAGQLGLIPGSMGARSYVVEGLGNPESFHSASHGAGRRMGRNEAKRQFTVADLAEQTAGVECRKDADVVDEIPGAYKDIDEVMELQKDLVRPVHVLKQFLCVKG